MKTNMKRKPPIPDYLVTLAGIIEAYPASETILLYRINQALEEVRKIAVGYHGLRASLIPDLVCLGEYHALAGQEVPPAAQVDAGDVAGGNVIRFPGGK